MKPSTPGLCTLERSINLELLWRSWVSDRTTSLVFWNVGRWPGIASCGYRSITLQPCMLAGSRWMWPHAMKPMVSVDHKVTVHLRYNFTPHLLYWCIVFKILHWWRVQRCLLEYELRRCSTCLTRDARASAATLDSFLRFATTRRVLLGPARLLIVRLRAWWTCLLTCNTTRGFELDLQRWYESRKLVRHVCSKTNSQVHRQLYI